MKVQRQADSVVAVVAQPVSLLALLRGVGAGLTNGVGCAKVTGMKTRANAGGAVVGVVQPAPSAVVQNGTAEERLASGVRCARVAGMNRRTGTQITRGGGALLLSLPE